LNHNSSFIFRIK